MSSTASVHSAKEVPQAEPAQPVETVHKYKDAEKKFQPMSLKFWTVIIGQVSVNLSGHIDFNASMMCLILALQWGGSTYSWSVPKIVGLLVTFSVLFIAFVVVEVLTPETAMGPTRVVLSRAVTGSMTLLSGGLILIVHYLTVWFQAAKGDSAMHSGISTSPLDISLVIMSKVGAQFSENIGYYVPAMLLSPGLCSIGAGLLSNLSPSSGQNAWISYQVLYGFVLAVASRLQFAHPECFATR
ncbi:MAG: hypothetical protein M1827_004929 [Pycnora praestabilis]|nr:MAG: hypothetical protein M1827_004929 [Pycnora praestabilis]